MALIADVVVGVGAKYDQFERGMKTVENIAVNTARTIQDRISAQFVGAGGKEFSRQIERQLIESTALQNKLYAATHTAQETALRGSEQYFTDLKTKWRDHEEMLTLITTTETAERARITKEYAVTLGFQWKRTLAEIAPQFIAVYVGIRALESGTNLATAAIVAYREKNASMFFEAIPLVGRLTSAFRKLLEVIYDIKGMTEALDEANKKIQATWKLKTEWLDEIVKNYYEMNRQLEMVQATESESKMLAPLHKYLDVLNSIGERRALMAVNSSAVNKKMLADLEREKELAGEIYRAQILRIKAEEVAAKAKPLQDIINAYEKQITAIGKTQYELMILAAVKAGATSADIAYLQRLRDYEVAMEAANDAVKEHNKLLDEGKRLTEQMLSPMEKYEARIELLGALLMANAINYDTWRQAVRNARSEWNQALIREKQGRAGWQELYSPMEKMPYMPFMAETAAGAISSASPFPAAPLPTMPTREDSIGAQTNLLSVIAVGIKELVRLTKGIVE